MAHIYLIRHGEAAAAWGESEDPGLSERGRAQAQAVAEALRARGVTELWTSPLARCRETAAPLAEALGLIPAVVPEIAEVPTPEGVADRRAWLARAFPTLAEDGRATRWAELPGLAAWRAAMIARAERARGTVAAFSHFIAINALASHALGREETIVARPAPGSAHAFEIVEGRLRLVALGPQIGDGVVL